MSESAAAVDVWEPARGSSGCQLLSKWVLFVGQRNCLHSDNQVPCVLLAKVIAHINRSKQAHPSMCPLQTVSTHPLNISMPIHALKEHVGHGSESFFWFVTVLACHPGSTFRSSFMNDGHYLNLGMAAEYISEYDNTLL